MLRAVPWLPLPLLVSTGALADSLVVHPDRSGDYPSIQLAVDAAADGDEILLTDGTFSGDGNHDVDLRGKSITIRSASGFADAVTLDCQGPGGGAADFRGFIFRTGEGPGTVLSDVMIRGALEAVLCSGASPELRNVKMRYGWTPAVTCVGSSALLRGCVVEANTRLNSHALTFGAVVLKQSDATLESCTVRANACTGIRILDASPTILDCLVSGNVDGGGIAVGGASSPVLDGCTVTGNRTRSSGAGLDVSVPGGFEVVARRCTFAGNRVTNGQGGGVAVRGTGDTTFEECTFTGNRADLLAGGLYLAGRTLLDRCTITGNRANEVGGVWVQATANPVTLERTILWGNCADLDVPELFVANGTVVELGCVDVALAGIYNYGTGQLHWSGDEIDEDPRFCQPASCAGAPTVEGIYTLPPNSPAYTAACGPMGALGASCTISIEPTTWGAIKAQYRE